MSYASAISVASASAVVAAFYSVRSIRSGRPPGEVAYWGAGLLGIGGFVFLYVLLGTVILGGTPADYLQPSLLGSRGERRELMLYAVMSVGLTMLVSGGVARAFGRKG